MRAVHLTSQSYESELVNRLRSGDRAAMHEFYIIYRNRLFSLILARVGGDHNAAEDLVQEVFLAALGSLDKFRGESQFYTWLRSIALHKLNDFYRRQAREPEPDAASSDFDDTRLEHTGDDQPATFTTMESEETRHSIHQALVGLPRDYRKVLILKYLDEKPVLEISRIMGRSPKSVEGLLSRARKAMRDNLAVEDQEICLQLRR